MKKIPRSFVVLVLVFSLVFPSLTLTAPSGDFPDVPTDHWAAPRIRRMAQAGVITGFPDGTFRLDAQVTREEIVTMLVRATGRQPIVSSTAVFSDVSPSRWSAGNIERAVAEGWVKGYPDGTFKPTNPVTRSEMAVMVVRLLGRENEATKITEPCLMANDEEDVPSWATGAMTFGYRAGFQFMTYREGRLATPKANATRAEAAYALHQVRFPVGYGMQMTTRRDMDPTGFSALFTQLGGTATAYAYMNEPFMGIAFKDDGSPVYYPRILKTVPTIENGLWEMLPGNKMEITYPMRSNLFWHDGEPLTADDVEFAYKVFMNPKVPIVSKAPYEKIEKLEVLNEHTFRITWKELYPHAGLINPSVGGYAGVVSLPKHKFEDKYNLAVSKNTPDGWKEFQDYVANNPVLAGAFRLKDYKPGQQVVFEANPYYYMGKPNISTLVMKIIPDTSTFQAMIMNGQIDFVGVYMDVALNIEAQKTPGLSVAYSPSQDSVLYIGANYNDPADLSKPHPILADIEFRKAMLHAIDREAINQVVFGGKHEVAHTWLASPRHPLYSMSGVTTYAYDPAKAKQILASRGWKAGSDGILVKDGLRASIKNVTPANSVPHEQAQMMIRDYLKVVGIEYVPDNMPWSTFSANYRRYRKFDTMMGDWGWGIFSEGDGYFLSNLTPSDANAWGGLNYYGWTNAENDAAINEVALTIEPAARRKANERHLQLFSEELPILPLLVYMNANVYKSRMCEYSVPGLDPGSFENSFRWYFESGE